MTNYLPGGCANPQISQSVDSSSPAAIVSGRLNQIKGISQTQLFSCCGRSLVFVLVFVTATMSPTTGNSPSKESKTLSSPLLNDTQQLHCSSSSSVPAIRDNGEIAGECSSFNYCLLSINLACFQFSPPAIADMSVSQMPASRMAAYSPLKSTRHVNN